MNYLVIAICVIAIVAAIVCKVNGLSLFLPTLIIILAVIVDIIVNTITQNKLKKKNTNLEDIKNSVKKKS